MKNGPKLVLLVEDDASLRQTLAEILIDEGFEVAPRADGQEALDWLQGAKRMPRVIVTDLVMPKVDGWELCSRLHKKTQWRAIPVVVLSSALHTRPRPRGTVAGRPSNKLPDLGYFLRVVNTLAAAPMVALDSRYKGFAKWEQLRGT